MLDVQDSFLSVIKVSFTTQTLYSTTIQKWHDVTMIPSTNEHVVLLWVCKYVFFPNFGKLAMEYLPLVKTIALGLPYALGTFLLASIYQAMSKFVYDEPYHRVGDTLWFVQMWLFAYFPKLADREITSYKTLGLHVAHSLRTMLYANLMLFFLGLVDRALVYLFLRHDFVHMLAWN